MLGTIAEAPALVFTVPLVSFEKDGKTIIPPRTKKNSPRMIPHLRFPKLLPSEAYVAWLDGLARGAAALSAALKAEGVELPISDWVGIRAHVYRDRAVGDLTGFLDAIGDAIQVSQWQCSECRQKFDYEPTVLTHRHAGRIKFKKSRDGLGLILNDSQIRDWDGSRLLKDAARPRVELEISVYGAAQKGLFG